MVENPFIPLPNNINNIVTSISPSNVINNLLLKLPSNVLNLPSGTILSGVVATSTPDGNSTVVTPRGNITINTGIPFDTGNELSFKIIESGRNFKLELININGHEINKNNNPRAKQTLSQQANSDEIIDNDSDGQADIRSNNNRIIFALRISEHKFTPNIPTEDAAIIEDIHNPISTGNIIKAVIISPNKENIKQLLDQLNLPVQYKGFAVRDGSEALIHVKDIIFPKEKVERNITTQLNNNAPIIDDFSLKIETNTPPSATLKENIITKLFESVTNNTKSTNTIFFDNFQKTPIILNGKVIANESSNHEVVIKTAIGLIKLPENAYFPIGSQISLELLSVSNNKIETISKNPHDVMAQLFSHWDSLHKLTDDILKNENISAPIKQDIKEHLPQPGQQFLNRLTNFIETIRTGDIGFWLGKSLLSSLKDLGKEDLIDEFALDLSIVKNYSSQQNNSQNWQTIIFPVYDGEDVYQTRLFIRQKPEEEKGNDITDTRFVVELETELSGPLQFDGLVRKYKPNTSLEKSFDLVIRSNKTLPKNMQTDITNIFSEFGKITGIKGILLFQVTDKFPINPASEVMNNEHSSTYV